MQHLVADHDVVVVVRDVARERPTGVAAVGVDLARPLDTASLPAQVDAIVHLAQGRATFPDGASELFAVNASSTQALLDYGRRAGVRRFILASTGDVYGWRLGPSSEDDPAAPASYYAVTKYAAELLVLAYAGYVQPCILRLFHPYGPGQTGRLAPTLARRVRTGEPIALHVNDRPRVSPLYVGDVVVAIDRALRSTYEGVLNVAGDRVVSIRELANVLGQLVGRMPVFDCDGVDASDSIGDNTRMKQILGSWTMVPLEAGLERMLAAGGAR